MGHGTEGDERDVERGYSLSWGGCLLCNDYRDYLLASGGPAKQELDPQRDFQRTDLGEKNPFACHTDSGRGQNLRRDRRGERGEPRHRGSVREELVLA